jgi:hypothetical protein
MATEPLTSERLMTAREIMARTLSEVTGKPESVFLAAFDKLPTQPPGLDWEYTPVEAEEMLAGFRKEAPGILRWLIEGAGRSSQMEVS